jgi:hypothetical protein
MRRTQTFLLTVLYDEGEHHRLRGRLRAVNHDGEQAFATTEELLRALYAALEAGAPPEAEAASSSGEGEV